MEHSIRAFDIHSEKLHLKYMHLKSNIVGIQMNEGNSRKWYVVQHEHVLQFENVLLEIVGKENPVWAVAYVFIEIQFC